MPQDIGQNHIRQNPLGQIPAKQNPTAWKADKIPQYEEKRDKIEHYFNNGRHLVYCSGSTRIAKPIHVTVSS